jgi:hypothetical protein
MEESGRVLSLVGFLQVPSKAINAFGRLASGVESRARNVPNTRQECQPLKTLFDGRIVCAVGRGDQQKKCRLSLDRCLASSIGIAAGWTAGIRFPARARGFSLPHSVYTGPGVHPASYPMVTGGGGG